MGPILSALCCQFTKSVPSVTDRDVGRVTDRTELSSHLRGVSCLASRRDKFLAVHTSVLGIPLHMGDPRSLFGYSFSSGKSVLRPMNRSRR